MRLDGNCTMKCWSMAAVFGALVFLFRLGAGFGPALILGLLTVVLLGLLFTWLFCAPIPQASTSTGGVAMPAQADGFDAGTSARASAAGVAGTAGAAAAAGVATGGAADGAATPAADTVTADDSVATTAEPETSQEAADAVAADVTAAMAAEDATPVTGETVDDKAADEDASSEAVSATQDAEPVATDPTPASTDASPVIKPSTPLAGEAELAERKGSWTYEKDGADPAAASAEAAAEDVAIPAVSPEAAPVTASASAAAAASLDGGARDFDGDGKMEGKDEGAKPQLLDGPRDGTADDLKQIKGIGPKLEKMCHEMGVYHFDQIAAWSDDEIAWVDANLMGFRGRVSRDKWRDQAATLASGGETEFSKRVEKGGVY